MNNEQSHAIEHEIAFFKGLCSELSAGKIELPTFPNVALRIKKALDDPDCSVDKVARVVSTEPVLTASLIRMANSAAFNRGNKPVTETKAAITRVGFDMARNTAISIALKQIFDPKKAKHLRAHLERIWKHSLKTAAIAYILPNKPASISNDEAMLMGLVHDIGKFYMLVRADSNPDLFYDESSLEELMELWHTGIGKVILETWEFPPDVVTSTDEHETLHQAKSRQATATDIVIVSNLLSYVGEASSPYKDINFAELNSFQNLNIDPEGIVKILANSKEQINSMLKALN